MTFTYFVNFLLAFLSEFIFINFQFLNSKTSLILCINKESASKKYSCIIGQTKSNRLLYYPASQIFSIEQLRLGDSQNLNTYLFWFTVPIFLNTHIYVFSRKMFVLALLNKKRHAVHTHNWPHKFLLLNLVRSTYEKNVYWIESRGKFLRAIFFCRLHFFSE